MSYKSKMSAGKSAAGMHYASAVSLTKKGKASTVLPNKRQTHGRVPETLYHRSTVFTEHEDGRVTVQSFTARHHGERRPTPKQRAKATKAMMKARGPVFPNR